MRPTDQKPAEPTRHPERYSINPITVQRGCWLFWGGMAVFALATALTGLWVISHDTMPKMLSLQEQLTRAKPYFLAWRIALMSVLLGCYPVWVNKVADWLHFEPWQRQLALKQRWPFAVMVILVEVLFPQRGPALLLHWLFPDL